MLIQHFGLSCGPGESLVDLLRKISKEVEYLQSEECKIIDITLDVANRKNGDSYDNNMAVIYFTGRKKLGYSIRVKEIEQDSETDAEALVKQNALVSEWIKAQDLNHPTLHPSPQTSRAQPCWYCS